jgi:Leucine-rich repeat (LRR) protein
MPNHLFCGKKQYPSQGVPLRQVLNATTKVVDKSTIDLAHSSLGDIKGIKKLPIKKCKKLDLSKNHLDTIEPLLKIKSKKLRYLYLQGNNLKNTTCETLLKLQEQFPNLRKVKLYENNIEDLLPLEELQSQLTYTLQLAKTITVEDD